mgnify:FL=1
MWFSIYLANMNSGFKKEFISINSQNITIHTIVDIKIKIFVEHN